MSCLVARFTPSRRYLLFAFAAVGGMSVAAWIGLRWSPAWIAAALFAISALGVFLLALRPPIEIHETHLQIGRRAIAWSQIRRLDQTGWSAPLAVDLTLMDHTVVRLLYPGDPDSCVSLLRHLRRYSREALLDGVPYRRFWGGPPAEAPRQLAPTRYRLLRPEDEEEVERMLQRLKSVGRLDPRGSDEK